VGQLTTQKHFFILGRAGPNLAILAGSILGPHDCWPNPTTRKRKKTRKIDDFFSTLASHFSSIRALNPPMFIGGGRGILFLFWRQILTLDSNWKDANHWFKVAIIDCQIFTTQDCKSPSILVWFSSLFLCIFSFGIVVGWACLSNGFLSGRCCCRKLLTFF
jgi:hypothetical protein